jgi:carbamate kinase
MGPKIQAAITFLEGGGKEVLITSPFRLEEAVAGATGTRIVPDDHAGPRESIQGRGSRCE